MHPCSQASKPKHTTNNLVKERFCDWRSLGAITWFSMGCACPFRRDRAQVFRWNDWLVRGDTRGLNPTACSASTLTAIKGESVTLTSNSSFATYEWTNSSGEVISQNNEFIINPEKSDCYDLYVEDNLGCIGYCSICIPVGSRPYDAFSPNNGDDFNNYWHIKDIGSFPGSTVQIFNRWGTLIFGPKVDCPSDCWDGTINGKDAPIGTYYYSIDHNDGSELLQGTITLVR